MSAVSAAQGEAPLKRPRQDEKTLKGKGKTKAPLEEQVAQLAKQLSTVVKIVGQHDKDLRELEAWSCHTFLMPKDNDLSQALLQAMEAWKAKIPDKGPHPLGAPRWTVAGTVAQVLLRDEANAEKLAQFRAFHEKFNSLEDMEASVQLAMARETRDGRVLLKIRPQTLRQTEWASAIEVLTTMITNQGGEAKSGAAPPSSLVRQLVEKQ